MTDPEPERNEEERSTEAGLELLARAVEYLSICRSDPARASDTDDPGLLVEGLRELLHDLSARRRVSRNEDVDERREPPAAA